MGRRKAEVEVEKVRKRETFRIRERGERKGVGGRSRRAGRRPMGWARIVVE